MCLINLISETKQFKQLAEFCQKKFIKADKTDVFYIQGKVPQKNENSLCMYTPPIQWKVGLSFTVRKKCLELHSKIALLNSTEQLK